MSQSQFDRTPYQRETVFSQTALHGIQLDTCLARLFFSALNIDALQQGIRYMVWKKSCKKHVIGRQSEDELKIVMRSIYLQHSVNKDQEVVKQVRDLNTIVIATCVTRILSELAQYLGYVRDASQLPTYMDRGMSTSVKGDKTLEQYRG